MPPDNRVVPSKARRHDPLLEEERSAGVERRPRFDFFQVARQAVSRLSLAQPSSLVSMKKQQQAKLHSNRYDESRLGLAVAAGTGSLAGEVGIDPEQLVPILEQVEAPTDKGNENDDSKVVDE